ncbi:MAG: sulfite exporter TauE/SafE family protein [Patescibacteria group bacterium]
MEFIYLVTFLVALISSTLSGIAGGGGGYLMAPYWLLSGMTPAQGATTGGFMAIGMGASSLAAFRKTDHLPRNKKLTITLAIVTVVASIIGAITLTHIETSSFKTILAIITILSIPMLFIDRRKIKLSKRHRSIGIGLLVLLLLVSSIITSSAFSIIITIGLSQLFNLTILQSTALRRVIGLVQSAVIFAALAFQGNFLVLHALAAIIGGSFGSYLGTRFAIKKGEDFARYALAVGAAIGAVMLLI